eukprot:2244309-Amphidinium_carterae.1
MVNEQLPQNLTVAAAAAVMTYSNFKTRLCLLTTCGSRLAAGVADTPTACIYGCSKPLGPSFTRVAGAGHAALEAMARRLARGPGP